MRIRLAIAVLSLHFMLAPGCIPATAPEKAAPPPNADAVNAPGPAAPMAPDTAAEVPDTETSTTEDGQTQVAISMPENPMANAVVQVEKRETGGFIVRGNMGLSGVIRRLGNQWRFDGRFKFPTAGYTVGEPTAIGLGTMHLDEVGATLDETTEQYIITIPVALPAVGEAHAEAIDEVPVGLDIDAPENANFMITLSQF